MSRPFTPPLNQPIPLQLYYSEPGGTEKALEPAGVNGRPGTMSLQQGAEALRARRISFFTPDGHTLKIGPINFYPTTGKITSDTPPRKCPEQGLSALLHLLKAKGLYKGEPK
jgi:hypothetical protein